MSGFFRVLFRVPGIPPHYPRPRSVARGRGGPDRLRTVRRMGKILYGGQGIEIEMDDRTMAHLQAVIASKLRRGEGFFLNWKDDRGAGDGHSAAWIAPDIPLFFRYYGGRGIELNRQWLEIMTMGANSNGGLQLGDEPSTAASAQGNGGSNGGGNGPAA